MRVINKQISKWRNCIPVWRSDVPHCTWPRSLEWTYQFESWAQGHDGRRVDHENISTNQCFLFVSAKNCHRWTTSCYYAKVGNYTTYRWISSNNSSALLLIHRMWGPSLFQMLGSPRAGCEIRLEMCECCVQEEEEWVGVTTSLDIPLFTVATSSANLLPSTGTWGVWAASADAFFIWSKSLMISLLPLRRA